MERMESVIREHEQPVDRRLDREGIAAAQEFFREQGITLEEHGLVDAEHLTEEDIAGLKEWQEATTESSIIMPDQETFYQKVLLAVSLWRQKEGEEYNYLLGKGVGVEVALAGRVSGRQRRKWACSYRTHSDFELYGADYTNGEPFPDAYPPAFKQVFGAQECYPRDATKGLHDLPPTLLHDTAEEVDLGGIPVYIPQLELLFLDKFVSPGVLQRPEGTDAEVLAKQYVLDRERIHKYLDQYVIAPVVREREVLGQALFQRQIEAIERAVRERGEDGAERLHREISAKRADRGDFSAPFVIFGIRSMLWEPIMSDMLNADGEVIDEGYRRRLRDRIRALEQQKIQELQDMHQQVDRILTAAEQPEES